MTRALRPEDISEDDLKVPARGPYRVLFVYRKRDENSPVLSHIERTSNAELIFKSVSSLPDAVSKVKLGTVDLVVLAHDVPAGQEFDGLALIKRTAPHLPVIILSNTRNRDLVEKAKQQGAQDFIITSPSSPIELVKLRLLCSIERSRTEQSARSMALTEKFIMRSMVDEAPLMFVRLDQTFVVRDCNRNFEEAMQESRTQLRGRTIFDILPSFKGTEIEALFAGNQLYHKRISMLDEEFYWNCFGWTFMKRNLDDKENILVIIDVTNEVLLNFFREEFIASVVHDIRNPMLGHEKIISALLNPDANFSLEETRAYLVKMRNSTVQLLNLLSTLVDSYRLEWGTNVLDSGTSINQVIEQQFEELECIAAFEGKRIELELTPQLPLAPIDHTSAYRLVANLVHNALQHSPPNTEIRIKTYVDYTQVVLVITNHGEPMTPSQKAKLFKRFSKITDSGKFRVNSSGLGLYFCKQTVDRCGGRIDLTSDPSGTTFTVKLPIKAAILKPSN